MPDKASMVGTLATLKANAAVGTTLPAVGSLADRSSLAGYPAVIQAGIVAGGVVGQFQGVDFGDLASARKIIAQQIPSTIEIAGTPVESTVVDVVYAGFTVTASLGVQPYTFSIFQGSLPTGLTLAAASATTAAVAGTPTEVETQTGIVIRVVDKFGYTADLDPFDIDVTES